MNILIDIGHPGHVHFFKNMAAELTKKGHTLFYSVRDIPIAKHLMLLYGMTPYLDLGKKRKSIIGKAQTVIHQDIQLYRFVKENKIDIGLSSGIVISHISQITKMESFIFDDDDDIVEKYVVKYGHPFSSVVCTPKSIQRKTEKALYYDGTHEIAYLHPNWFSPDKSVLFKAGLSENEPFFIMRFVAFNGHHDVGQYGLSFKQKQQLIKLLSNYGRVIISSEKKLEPEFEQYRLPIVPEEIHSLMAFATMFIGDSQTMTSEAAILGTPAIKCNTFASRLSVPNELEKKYGLCFAYQPKEYDIFHTHIKTLLNSSDLKGCWRLKKERFIADKIDVTAFFVWFIENYPESKKIMKENPDYQYRFR